MSETARKRVKDIIQSECYWRDFNISLPGNCLSYSIIIF